MSYRIYPAKLIRIVDADTAYFECDVGFRVWVKMDFRLAGLNAPEIHTAEGIKAKDWLTNAFAGFDKFTLAVTGADKYGRWLAYVYPGEVGPKLMADVTSAAYKASINNDMISQGVAKPWDGQGAKPV